MKLKRPSGHDYSSPHRHKSTAIRMHKCEDCGEVFIYEDCMQVMADYRESVYDPNSFGGGIYAIKHVPLGRGSRPLEPWLCEECKKRSKRRKAS